MGLRRACQNLGAGKEIPAPPPTVLKVSRMTEDPDYSGEMREDSPSTPPPHCQSPCCPSLCFAWLPWP